MSEHAWVLESIAAYLADGLDAAERDRLVAHTALCPDCARALAEARALDGKLDALFAPVRPTAALYTKAAEAVRTFPARRRRLRFGRVAKIMLGAAAAVLLGLVGAVVQTMLDDNGKVPGAVASGGFPKLLALFDTSGSMDTSDDSVSVRKSGPRSVSGKFVQGLTPAGTLTPDSSQLELKDASTLAAELWKENQNEPQRGDNGMKSVVMHGTIHHGRNFDKREEVAVGGERTKESQQKLADPSEGRKPGKEDGGKQSEAKARDLSRLSTTYYKETGGNNEFKEEGWGHLPAKERARKHGVATKTPVTTATAKYTVTAGEFKAQVADSDKSPDKAEKQDLAFSPDGTRLVAGGEKGKQKDKAIQIWSFFDNTTGKTTKEYFKPGDAFAKMKQENGRALDDQRKATEEAARKGNGDKKDGEGKGEQPPDEGKAGLSKAPDEGKGKADLGGDDKKEPAKTGPPAVQKPMPDADPMAGPRKVIIRSGDIEFEVDSFDGSVAAITKLVLGIKGGFIATINSDKLANGKVQGSVVIRIPPEALDGFILDLRRELGKGGELKGQKIGSQDVTKQYIDLESRLKAARTMEDRLLKIIKDGKGEIKDLLLAEKELGTWRTRIEELEGELRYYANMAALSTLTITLTEKDLRTASSVSESERVQMGIETEDVDKALRDALKAVEEAKGRVTCSEMKQHAAGQFNAKLHFEVERLAAGPMRDRLRQLGTVARMEIDRVQSPEGGTKLPLNGKIETIPGRTLFLVSLYNLANVAPRETVTLRILAADVPAAYQAVRDVAGTKGHVVNANLNEQDRQNVVGQLEFDVKRADEDAMRKALAAAGDVLARRVNRLPAGENVTDTKVLYKVEFVSPNAVEARETVTQKLVAADVATAYHAVRDLVRQRGHVINAQLNEQDRQNVTAQLDFHVKRQDEEMVKKALAAAGDFLSRNVTRAAEGDNVTDSKVLYKVEFLSVTAVDPRETVTLAVEVTDVERELAALNGRVREAQGRVVKTQIGQVKSGQVTAHVIYDVPLSAADGVIERAKNAGTVRVHQVATDTQMPTGKLAIARIDVTLSNADILIPRDEGLWAAVRGGLSVSLRGLSYSLNFLIVGLLFVLPWVLLIYAGVWVVRRMWPAVPATETVAEAPPAPPSGGGTAPV